MTEQTSKVRIDMTLNLPMLVSAVVIVAGAGAWGATVTAKLDTVAALVVASARNSEQIAQINTKLATLDARTEASARRGERIARAVGANPNLPEPES